MVFKGYLLVVSVVFGMVGIVLFVKRIALAVGGVRSVGRFVRWHVDYSLHKQKRAFYFPVISFQAEDGKVYELTGVGSSRRAEGRKLYPVIYPPGSPEKAIENRLMSYWLSPIGFFVLAIGMAAAAYKI